MAISQNQLDQFHQFATELISEREVGFSLPELFDLWRIKNPATEEQVDVKNELYHRSSTPSRERL